MGDVTVTHHPGSLDTIQAMVDEANRVERLCGQDDDRTHKAWQTLAQSLTQMLLLRPTRVMSDGTHSLVCQSEYLTYGVNYTGASYNDDSIGSWSVNS